jgi:hypothetical protein
MDIKQCRFVGIAFHRNKHLRISSSFNFDLWVKDRARRGKAEANPRPRQAATVTVAWKDRAAAVSVAPRLCSLNQPARAMSPTRSSKVPNARAT